jgi:5'-nucleotidase
VTAKAADNVIVQGEAFTSGPTTVALTDQYPVFGKNQEVAALISAVPCDRRAAGAARGGPLTATATRT